MRISLTVLLFLCLLKRSAYVNVLENMLNNIISKITVIMFIIYLLFTLILLFDFHGLFCVLTE